MGWCRGAAGQRRAIRRIELLEDGERLYYGLTYATYDGSFAIRAARRAQAASSVELHTASGRRFSIAPGRSDALIDHGAQEFAVIEETPGVMQFRGRLSRTPSSTDIERLWAVNWTTGRVAPVAPPLLDVDFDHARIAGTAGHCMGLFSEHESGRAGGCWWATPGGCLCRRCEPEELAAGTCEEPPPPPDDDGPGLGCHCEYPPPPVPGQPGRAPLDARERRDPEPTRRGSDRPPPPYRDGVPPPMMFPPDAAFTPWDANADAGPVGPPS